MATAASAWAVVSGLRAAPRDATEPHAFVGSAQRAVQPAVQHRLVDTTDISLEGMTALAADLAAELQLVQQE